ncbi:lipase 2 [Conoideocrella luteorostrata]|uniref:GPI inositol-deacylase n=1 Tax=Conoideocrella luteorostrata TaxID=1105319 RepID=A0AAJ0CIL7_9HYPO|nr:lipase 2 [Conoideocrella luteorostrata]
MYKRPLQGTASSIEFACNVRLRTRLPQCRQITVSSRLTQRAQDPRVRDIGRQIKDDYASIREQYATPKYPVVLAHGLLGFSELQLLSILPTIHYWHGIREALTAQGTHVITASVPPSSSIADRAAKLADDIASQHDGPVNIIAHSMGGLDARYMISNKAQYKGALEVASLTTISTPHRGSPFADYVLNSSSAGILYLPRLYKVLERAGFGTQAFTQLTTGYMEGEFNEYVVDDAGVRYFSYGAVMDTPPLLSPFRVPQRIIERVEGVNDGLVSVESSRWGVYQGTLVGVNHMDLINWPNRVRWMVRGWMGKRRRFNAVAFYLGIADMLAKEGM